MADELIMGIDAGTSRVRVLVFEMDGTVVAQGSSEPKVDRPNPGWASTESEDLWSSCLEAMFPMNQNAQDLMMNAPSTVNENQLKELNLSLKLKK